MKSYIDIVKHILTEGKKKESRTGGHTFSVSGCMFKHDWENGFPLETTKKVPLRLVASELEFFIQGHTDKKWLQDQDNHIWDDWCSPEIVPYGQDEETKQRMKAERDLGPIYGFQWRHFGAEYRGYDVDYGDEGIDQLENLVQTLESNPHSRRMIVNAWAPQDLHKMALPPCHYGFQVLVNDNTLDLLWDQRSVDTMLGLPFNIASYGLLQHLLCKETGYKPGTLTGFLGDVHIYGDHVENAKKQVQREPRKFPTVKTPEFTSIFDWSYEDSVVEGYDPHPHIKYEIAV